MLAQDCGIKPEDDNRTREAKIIAHFTIVHTKSFVKGDKATIINLTSPAGLLLNESQITILSVPNLFTGRCKCKFQDGTKKNVKTENLKPTSTLAAATILSTWSRYQRKSARQKINHAMFCSIGLANDMFSKLGPVGSDPLGDLFHKTQTSNGFGISLEQAKPNEPSLIVCKFCNKFLPKWCGASHKCPTVCCCGVKFHVACLSTMKSQKITKCPNCTKRMPPDYKACAKYLKKHTKEGQAWAECMLAEWYFYGDAGVEKSIEKAVELYERAVAQGYVTAIKDLAQMYLLGDQIPQDIERGLDLFELACRENHPEALLHFHEWYMHGRYGITKNEAKAKALLLKGVDYSDHKAQQRVAFYHYMGWCGFEINYSKARNLLESSAKGGLQESITALNKLKKNKKICAACQRPEFIPFLDASNPASNTTYPPVKFNRCGGCKLQYYCNKMCQKADWAAGHKKECKRTFE